MVQASSLLALAWLASACGGVPTPSGDGPKAPTFEPKDQSKCGVTKSQARPLIVEWPSADRAALEAQAKRGLVAVHYVGCEMEVLRQCRAPGKYGYTGITRKRDKVTMRDADELYANIPAYAAKFEGKLAKSGQLNVDMTIVGTFDADRSGVALDELEGECAGATHVVTGLTAGSFQFYAGASAEAGASVDVAGAGAGAKTESSRETLNQDGDDKACEKATTKDSEPPDGCGALLRVEVVPLAPAGAGKAATGKTAPAATTTVKAQPGKDGCPGGMVSIAGGAYKMADRDVKVADLCMDATEVTAGAYAECVQSGKCDGAGLSCGPLATYGVASKKDYPQNCVDFDQAAKYCAAHDARLPFEEEWEWAARGGSSGFLYPWGNDTLTGQACWSGAGAAGPCAAGSHASGTGALGVADLIGNLWEWTSSIHTAKGGLRVIRGGSFAEPKPDLLVSNKRIPNMPTDRNVNLGFRCVKPK